MTTLESPGAPAPEPAPHHSVASRIRNYFLTGLIVAGPVAITIWLVWSFVTWVDDLVRPFFPVAYRPETYLPIKVPGFGLIIAFLALTVLGFLTANLVGRTFVDIGEQRTEFPRRGGPTRARVGSEARPGHGARLRPYNSLRQRPPGRGWAGRTARPTARAGGGGTSLRVPSASDRAGTPCGSADHGG